MSMTPPDFNFYCNLFPSVQWMQPYIIQMDSQSQPFYIYIYAPQTQDSSYVPDQTNNGSTSYI